MAIEPKPMSKSTALTVTGLSGLLILWAIAVAVAAFFANRFDEGLKPAYILGGFELIVVIAGAIGIWLAWKRSEENLGMALACIGGTMCVASFLGALSVQYELLGYGLKPAIAARVAIGLLFCGMGASSVLSRHERSWPLFWKGVFIASPLIVMVGYAITMRFMMRAQAAANPVEPNAAVASNPESVPAAAYTMMGPLENAPTAVKGLVIALISIICVVSLCACTHIFIKAFELGRFTRERIALPKKK